MKVMVIPILICAFGSHQRIDTGSGGLGNKRMKGDHSNYCIIKIGQNTKKSPGNLKRLAVTQTGVKNSQKRKIIITLGEEHAC